MEALSGLLLVLFVSMISITVVATALPQIIGALHGTQSQYTWVVTAALLSSTASTPIWGKLADLFSKKALVQIAIVMFILGSVLCGIVQNTPQLIAARAFQGLGMGGLQALVQVVIAAMIPPRERGRYNGYLGGVMALATVGGPLLGGVIVDTSWLGWRWCFYVGVPFALVALVLLQKTLHLKTVRRPDARIDYLGATLIAAGVSVLLIWVTFVHHNFAWLSWQTAAMVGGGVVLLALAVLVEARVSEPIVPLRIVVQRTPALAIVASVAIGMAMFGGSVFLGQYFQIARGYSPTKAGLMTIPMMAGILVASTIAGLLITKSGKIKPFIVTGAIVLVVGFAGLATIDHATKLVYIGVAMALVGIGVGMTMQNLVLAVQNTVALRDIGSASGTVTFFRSLGGTIGVSVLGAVLADRVATDIPKRMAEAGIRVPAGGGGAQTGTLDLHALPKPIVAIIRATYGDGIGHVFLISAVVAVLSVLAALALPRITLRSSVDLATPAPAEGAGPKPAPGAAANGAPYQAAHAAIGLDPVAVAPPSDGPAVTGRVEGPDRRAIAAAVLTVTDFAGRQVARGVTEPDGQYRLGLPTGGTYLLICAADNHEPVASMVVVGTGDVRRDIVLAGASLIEGRVLRHGGEPIGGATVTLTDARGEVVGAAVTGPDGEYVLADLYPGEYVLTATADGARPLARGVTVEGVGSHRVDVVLHAGATVTGTVRAARTGQPVAEASVVLMDGYGNVAGSITTGADGRYEFGDLLPGRYTLTASGYAPVATRIDLAGERIDRDIALGDTGTPGSVPVPGSAANSR
ncbi:MFS transporter [Planosporangium mesophilum]|uniref:MFS transporter n=1 Tax=Planosporangium mesophilum TaxID=689768 RepID=A0A8J3TER5_9ACTN|nr:MFS transporter [Planosporangium mesophilum]